MARLYPDQAFASISGKRTPQQSGTNDEGEEEKEEKKSHSVANEVDIAFQI